MDSRLDWRPEGGGWQEAPSTAGASLRYEATIGGLQPQSSYSYRVRAGSGGPVPDATGRTEFTFRTPRSDAVKLAFMGDTGSGEPRQYDVAARLATEDPPPDGIMIVGDLVYPRGEDAGYDGAVLRALPPAALRDPLLRRAREPRLRDLLRRPAPRRLHAALQLPVEPGPGERLLGRAGGRADDRARHHPPRHDAARRRPAVARDGRASVRRLPPRRAAPSSRSPRGPTRRTRPPRRSRPSSRRHSRPRVSTWPSPATSTSTSARGRSTASST